MHGLRGRHGIVFPGRLYKGSLPCFWTCCLLKLVKLSMHTHALLHTLRDISECEIGSDLLN
jgi:hypothetical protein